jgi:hypothetical protein
MQKFCLALDLIDEPESIKKYEYHHAKGNAWPEVTQHDIDAGILNIELKSGKLLCPPFKSLCHGLNQGKSGF